MRARAVLSDFKTEIELRDLRAKQHEERYKQFDEDIERYLKTKGTERVVNTLLQMWKAEASHQETISHKRWQRSKKWLETYKTNFLQEYWDKDSFFKTTDDWTEQPINETQTFPRPAKTE